MEEFVQPTRQEFFTDPEPPNNSKVNAYLSSQESLLFTLLLHQGLGSWRRFIMNLGFLLLSGFLIVHFAIAVGTSMLIDSLFDLI